MRFFPNWFTSAGWQVAQSWGVTTTWTLYPLCSKLSLCFSAFRVWHSAHPTTTLARFSGICSKETLLSLASTLLAALGITLDMRLFFQAARMPGLKVLWHSMQAWESSLIGTSAPEA